MNKKMYRLYDVYDGYSNRVKIGEYDTMDEVRRAALQWDVEETDGECAFALYQLQEDGKYHLQRDFTY